MRQEPREAGRGAAGRRGSRLPRGISLAQGLAFALSCGLAGGVATAQEAPEAPISRPDPGAMFEVLQLAAPGRTVEVVSGRFGEAPGARARGLVVAAIEGTPPEERRRLLVFLPDARGRIAPDPVARIDVPSEVVAYDVGPARPGGPDVVALLSADALRIHPVGPAGADGVTQTVPLAPPAPLPARVRELSRLSILGDWNGDGRPLALVPSLGGARLVPLTGEGAERLIALPVAAEYELRGPGPPARDEWLRAEVIWPVLERADDDADGRADLFALGRYGASVHRAGPEGLATLPVRALALRPFLPEEELRHRATSLRLRAADLDGDGRADVLVQRNAGTLLRSRAVTELFWNPGGAASFPDRADVRREETGALTTCDPVDLDGDGRSELVESRTAFGVLQLARILATRRVEVELRVLSLARGEAPRVTWTGSLSLQLDFGEGRIVGILPTPEGDWNGDGRRDVLHGVGAEAIAVRLGEAGPEGPGFGPVAATQAVSAEGHAVVSDLDGDGLDDLVVYDPREAGGGVRVLRNLGRLPGTPPGIRAAP